MAFIYISDLPAKLAFLGFTIVGLNK